MSRRIVFPAKGVVELQPHQRRAPGPGELQVRTLYSLMSIGTETTILHARYAPGTHFAQRFSFPQMKTGVQSLAVIEALGEGVTGFAVGEQVFMRMAHVSHWTLAAAQCSPVPSLPDLKSACWCGLAKTAFRAAHAGPFRLGGEVLIIGAGPVGQMALRWARAGGMHRIAVVDTPELRLALARAGGATHCLRGELAVLTPQLLELSAGGFALVVDTTGNAEVFAQALAVTGRFGRLVLLGDTGYPGNQRLSSDMMTRGLEVVAVHDHHDRDGWTERRIDALFFELVRDGRFPLQGLITHEFAPEQCVEAYALASERRGEALGILFDWTRLEG
jgi:threonine dehydrogenase-like Zn-dependent dehydrogenase